MSERSPHSEDSDIDQTPKSSWKNPGLPDRLRPLNKRGKRDAPVMGERLAERGIEVERVICRPATRALATAEVITGEIGFPWDEVIYPKKRRQSWSR